LRGFILAVAEKYFGEVRRVCDLMNHCR